MLEVITRFKEGGSYMWVILAVGAWIAAIAIDRIIVLFMKSNINAETFMDQIDRLVGAGDIGAAIKYCNTLEEKPLARVIKAALEHANESIERVNSAIDEAVLAALPKLQKRISYLFTLANVATLLGLMGTIQGLIESFSAMDVNDPASQARQLGSGISTAMLTTAFGLVVAVPTIILHTVIQNKTEQLIEEIDHGTTRLLNILGKKPAKAAAGK